MNSLNVETMAGAPKPTMSVRCQIENIEGAVNYLNNRLDEIDVFLFGRDRTVPEASNTADISETRSVNAKLADIMVSLDKACSRAENIFNKMTD